MPPPPLYRRVKSKDGRVGLDANFHPGQRAAINSQKRIVAVIAGGRSGKTVVGPPWLHQEMLAKGPGDYLVVGPNYPIIDKAAGPEIRAYFESLWGLGTMRQSPMQFTFSPDGCKRLGWGTPDRQPRIIFAHADNPEGLEAMSAKAAWLDEAGQTRFRLGSFEAVQQRLSIDQGRCLITTKPYTLNWLKTRIYDPWREARIEGGDHPDIDVINFGSEMNPAFPLEELERARATLPGWKYRMHYQGHFERPAGRIYECWDESIHIVAPFRVPYHWERYGGIDFGGVNTAAVILARHPRTRKLYLIAEYHRGGLTAAQHARALTDLVRRGWVPDRGERPPTVKLWCGGSKSEDQWRREFAQAGIVVTAPPISDVEVGITRVHSMLVNSSDGGPLAVFSSCTGVCDDIASYSRVVDEAGEPTEAIADKDTWHRLDALRYIATRLEPEQGKSGKKMLPYYLGDRPSYPKSR